MRLPHLPRSLRRLKRRFGCWLTWAEFQLIYHPAYTAAHPDLPVDPSRAEHILAFLASEGFVLRRSVHRPEAVWWKALEKVHTAEYLDAVHDAQTLTSAMGTAISPHQIDRMLDLQRLHVGGTMMATRRARSRGVGVNLGGGLHHAAANRGGGFCIFNDVATAIADERRHGFSGRVLVVDLDLHDGDGTRSIFAEDPEVYTFSIHARHWGPTEALASTSLELGSKVDDTTYLAAIEEHLPAVFREFRPHLVFYLAGCDPAVDDHLGDWRISAEGMLRRDQRVFALARQARRLPLVILLAGGYGHGSWRYSARFLANLWPQRRIVEPPSTDDMTLKRYRYISSLFGTVELSGGSEGNFGITADDLFLSAWGGTKETRFLGFYTKNGIERVLERSGFLDRLRDLGFPHPTLELQLDDPGGQTLRIFGAPDHLELLVELRLRRDRRAVPGFELLSIEWLLSQNPRARFTPERPGLPGQSHPGLGILNEVAALLRVACERLHLDGLVFVPSQYHVAAYGHGHLHFLDPELRARFHALLKLFHHTHLAEATRLVAEGRVVDATSGEVFRWDPQPMVLPVSRRLKRLMKRKKEELGPREVRYRLLGDG